MVCFKPFLASDSGTGSRSFPLSTPLGEVKVWSPGMECGAPLAGSPINP